LTGFNTISYDFFYNLEVAYFFGPPCLLEWRCS